MIWRIWNLISLHWDTSQDCRNTNRPWNRESKWSKQKKPQKRIQLLKDHNSLQIIRELIIYHNKNHPCFLFFLPGWQWAQIEQKVKSKDPVKMVINYYHQNSKSKRCCNYNFQKVTSNQIPKTVNLIECSGFLHW